VHNKKSFPFINSITLIFPEIPLIYLYIFLRKTENTLTFQKNVLQYIHKVCVSLHIPKIISFEKEIYYALRY